MDSVIEPYNEEVPSYKRIAKLVLREQPLPRTRLSKLRRHIIRQEIAQTAPRKPARADDNPAPLPEDNVSRVVLRCLEESAGRKVLPDEHFEMDLGLDSLGKMALFTSLCKTLDKNLPLDMLAKHPTGRKLAEAITALDAGGFAQSQAAGAEPATELPRTAWSHGMYRRVISLYLHAISRIKVNGLENIPVGPCIFAPNHQSSLDAFYLVSAMDGKRFRETYFYVISKYISGRFSGWFARRHNMIPMEINGDLRVSLGKLSQALKQGKSVLIFPEGTRSMDGGMGEFRPAFAQIAVETGAAVVPVAIDGSFDVLPRNRRFPRLGKTVTLSFLPPCETGRFPTVDAIARETREKIHAKLQNNP
jgi:long-chain acyl-CoA synthetase